MVRGSVPSDEGKIPPRGRTPVRTQYVSPARGVAGYASRRRRYLLAQRPKLHRTTVHGLARTDTGRAIGLPVLWVVRESKILVITKISDFRTTTVDRLARQRGWVVSCRHPIPCCRGRGTVSTVWCVSAGRTPVFPDWFRRLSYQTFDLARHKSVASGVKVNAIHARREQRGVGDATGRRRKAPSTPGLSRCLKVVIQ